MRGTTVATVFVSVRRHILRTIGMSVIMIILLIIAAVMMRHREGILAIGAAIGVAGAFMLMALQSALNACFPGDLFPEASETRE